MRLAIVASHPIQYYAPLFREVAREFDLTVFFAHRATPADQAAAGFSVEFDWDVDLLSGYRHVFLQNIARRQGVDRFHGCDTPDIGSQLAEARVEAVLVQGWYLKSFVQACLAAKRLGLPLLVRGDSQLGTPRSTATKTLKAIAYPLALRIFDAALYVGENSRLYWRHYKYPSTRLFFSPHCVDTKWFAARATPEARFVLRARLGIPQEAKVVLFAGKLIPIKRPLDVIGALRLLRDRGRVVTMVVAGAGPLECEVVAAAQASGVTLHSLGFCNQSYMPATYAAADVLVLPSESETWGLVANEALACGRPIVVSDVAGCAPDLAEDGVVGRVFPVGNIPALADAIAEPLNQPPLAEAIFAKSATYSIDAAAKGIFRAVSFAAECRRIG